jgi:crossover junction endodeoxyribonuclease RuvC
MKNSILLGIDPGLATMGYGAIALPPDVTSPRIRLDLFGVFETHKSNKKAHVLATEDNLRRARELTAYLVDLIDNIEDDRNRLVAICAESMSWPRNAGTSAKIGIAWGVLASVAHIRNVPIVQSSPQAVKKALCGRRDASKDEIRAGVLDFLMRANGGTEAKIGRSSPTLLIHHEQTIKKKALREHPWDATAVALMCRSAEVVQMARRLGTAQAVA